MPASQKNGISLGGVASINGVLTGSIASVNGVAVGAPPVNTVLPTISGTQEIGETLTCSAGTWTGSPTITFQWKRDGMNIGGATASTYEIESVSGKLSCYVTGTNGGGSATVRADSGEPRKLWLCGDSLIAPAGITSAVQSALDAEFGAGAWSVTNVAVSAENVVQMETRAQAEVDPNIDVDWAVVWFFEYANQTSGLQGTSTGAETAALLYAFGENRAAAGGLPIFTTAPYDQTQADIASELIRANYASHGGIALTDLDKAVFKNDIIANDGIHWTSAVYGDVADEIVATLVAAGLTGGAGGIDINPPVYENLKVHLAGGGSAYIYDPVTPLQISPDPAGSYIVVTSTAGGWTEGAYRCTGSIDDFNTADGPQDLWLVALEPAATGVSGGDYVPPYATSGRHEVSEVVFATDIAGAANGSYFIIRESGGASVGVYLDNGTASPPGGVDRTIAVSFTNNDTGTVIGAAVAAALIADGSWWINDTGSGGSYVVIADKLPGARTAISASGFGITANQRVAGN